AMFFTSWQKSNRRQRKAAKGRGRRPAWRKPYSLRLEELEDRCLLSTFTVDTTNAYADLSATDHGSLQGGLALLFANKVDTIQFKIVSGNQTITLDPAKPLVPIAMTAGTIDGTTQPGGVVTINGNGLADGFVITTGSTTVKGLKLTGFSDAAIVSVTNGSNSFTSNTIVSNKNGIVVASGCSNTIDSNVISGNTAGDKSGHWVSPNSSSNIVNNNFIGTDFGGNNAQGNDNGVVVGAANNSITNNTISGNPAGLTLAASGNTVTGNFVGLNGPGTGA